MQLVCPHCRAAFPVADRRPSFCAFCGQPLPANDSLSATLPPLGETGPPEMQSVLADGDVPEQVGGYRLLRQLGRGGMGAVYEAEDVGSGRRVALKLLAPEFASSPLAVERFRREGQLASRIIHPRCVFVLAADEDAGRPYIVMELMPGETLKDLVEREGPLPPARAVELTLDLLAGLRETHGLGLIHRDVKPSNCFLQPDGRVKVGDFGLSKSLAEASELTRTGTFVGTVLFASPEQVRKDKLDGRTDVYSAAATLYFLLTGRAPFESDDAMATMARIVSDDPPSLREARRDIPADLERVVLRGLARDPARRWRSVDDFEAALVPFLPSYQATGSLRVRFIANVLDWILLATTFFLCLVGYKIVLDRLGGAAFEESPGVDALVLLVSLCGLYLVVPEGLWGCSPGKYLLRLRVRREGTLARPGFGRVLLRTCVWCVLVVGLWLVPDFLVPESTSWYELLGNGAFFALGIALLIAPMRQRNGYRGLHEWLSGTQVVTVAPRERPRPTRTVSPRGSPHLTVTGELPAAIGPFRITGAWQSVGPDRVFQAEDPKLQRAVCVWLRGGESTSSARRELSRPTRLRWLASGEADGQHWDAFVAPVGRPLAQVVEEAGPLTWKELRPLLEQLAEELDAASRDGTLPLSLSVDQVRVRPGGVELLDFRPGTSTRSGLPASGSDSLALLREVVVLALGVTGSGPTLRMPPLPEHAGMLIRRLLAEEQPYRTVAELLRDLSATRERPAEVTRGLRAAQLILIGAGLILGHLVTFALLQAFAGFEWTTGRSIKTFATLLQFWVLWAILWRGGVGLRLFGLTLVGPDGRAASRLRCAWRAFLVWAPVWLSFIAFRLVMLWVELSFEEELRNRLLGRLGLFWGLTMIALPFVYLALGLWSPQRSVFDRLAGTAVVPK
jgi:hypothetical protein